MDSRLGACGKFDHLGENLGSRIRLNDCTLGYGKGTVKTRDEKKLKI